MPSNVYIRPRRWATQNGANVNSIGHATGPGEIVAAGGTSSRSANAMPANTDYVELYNAGSNLVVIEIGPADSVVAVATTSSPLPPGVGPIHYAASPGQKIAVLEITA